MPNRIVRDGILSSARVDQLDAQEEVFYRRLMSVVDDYGRYYASPISLLAACYPLRIESIRKTDISRWLGRCQTAGLIALYEVGGAEYVQVLNWQQRTRALKSKFPEPPQSVRAQEWEPPPDRQMTVTCPSSDGHVPAQTEAYSKAKAKSLETSPKPENKPGLQDLARSRSESRTTRNGDGRGGKDEPNDPATTRLRKIREDLVYCNREIAAYAKNPPATTEQSVRLKDLEAAKVRLEFALKQSGETTP